MQNTTASIELIEELRVEINQQLQQGLNELNPKSLYEPVSYILDLGGKRIRPLLTLLSAGAVSGNHTLAMPAAMAVEYLHNFTLMHDDIMDKADMRRGKASVHAKWNESTAILSGDVMFTMAMQWMMKDMSQQKSLVEKIPLLCDTFLRATRKVCEGQALDMELAEKQSASTEDYMLMIQGKTAVLLGASMKLGAIFGGADQEIQQQYYSIGENAGMAFQLQDDYLDVFGNSEKTGKIKAGDIKEKKRTYLYLHTLNASNESDRKQLERIYSHESVPTDSEVQDVVRLMLKYEAEHANKQIMEQYYNQAQELLTLLPKSAYSESLTSIIKLLWKRDH